MQFSEKQMESALFFSHAAKTRKSCPFAQRKKFYKNLW